jgi:hypothetical protein
MELRPFRRHASRLAAQTAEAVAGAPPRVPAVTPPRVPAQTSPRMWSLLLPPACINELASNGLAGRPAVRPGGTPLGAWARQRVARRRESASKTSTAAGMTHQAGAPALAMSAVAPSATTTPSAVNGSSPTTNSQTA